MLDDSHCEYSVFKERWNQLLRKSTFGVLGQPAAKPVAPEQEPTPPAPLSLQPEIVANLDVLNHKVERLDQIAASHADDNNSVESLKGVIEQLRFQVADQARMVKQLSQSQRVLLQQRQRSSIDTAPVADGPLVSVIMAVWNREQFVAEAIESLLLQSYANWQLVIVDDGSTDGTIAAIEPFLADDRIKFIKSEHLGICSARNRALAAADGEVITYLDSDVCYEPDYLNAVVSQFQNDSECESVYTAQSVCETDDGTDYIRDLRYSRQTYQESGGIDLNVFAHRAELVSRYGGFDESLNRLVDWDLIARYTAHRDPVHLPIIGSRYRQTASNRVSDNGQYWRNRYIIQRKMQRPIANGLRVLYVVNHHPQLTETYVRWEMECMRRWGVEVHVWSRIKDVTSPYPCDLPHHKGTLEQAMEAVKPQLVHFHWLNIALMYVDQITPYGAIATVRGHGYEYTDDQTVRLLEHPTFRAVYSFPHYAEKFGHVEKSKPMPAAFNGDLYYPESNRDHRLVVRAVSAKSTKGIETFFEVARRCPQHRFVLMLGRLNGLEQYVQQVIEDNERHGSPVEIRVNVPHEQAAQLVRSAGIYLHTYGDEEPFGMPISIAEAMASGCYTLVRNLPGAAQYVGTVGAVYDDVTNAVNLIQQTETWYAEDWHKKAQQSVEYAYERFADIDVYRPMLNDWQEAVSVGVDPATLIDVATLKQLQPILALIHEENRASSVSVFERPFLNHLLGTYQQLCRWNAEQDVCYAGLVHSLYNAIGQDRFLVSEENRAKLTNIIGKRAEGLAYLFQSTFRATFDQLVMNDNSGAFYGRFTEGAQRITDEDFESLCKIHLAEWLEKRKRISGQTTVPEVYYRIAKRLGGVFESDFQSEVHSSLTKPSHDQSVTNTQMAEAAA